MEIYLKRLQLLGSEGVCGKRIESANSHAKEVENMLEKLNESDSSAVGKIIADLETIAHYTKEEEHKRILAESEHLCRLKQLHVDMEMNEKAQSSAWEEIYAAVNKLNDLGAQRHKIVYTVLAEREERDRAQGVYEGMKRYATYMTTRLKALQEAVENSLGFQTSCREHCASLHETITKRMASILDATREAALIEEKEYLSVFQVYYLSLGGLLHSKQKQVEDLDRMMRNNLFQIEVCLETLDADVTQYEKMNEEFQTRRDIIAEKVENLQARGDEQYDLFRPTENALIEADFVFVKPCVMLEEQNITAGQKLLEKRRAHFGVDQEVLTVQEEILKKTAVVTEQARKSGLSSLIKPLSGDGAATPRKPSKGTARRIVSD
jgi:hypothetical protein